MQIDYINQSNLPKELKDINLKGLYTSGDVNLFKKDKIAIVGTRRPSAYTKIFTDKLSSAISNANAVVVSGAAMGVDAIAHRAAKKNTIAVMANSLDIIYPKVNKNLINEIYQNSLAITEYKSTTTAKKYYFIDRNRIVVALSKAVVITEADENSGSIRSAEWAIKYKKPIYVLPHRMNESKGTNILLKEGKAEAIYSIDEFLLKIGLNKIDSKENDEFLNFIDSCDNYDTVFSKFGDKIFEYELEGLIKVENGRISKP